MHVFHRVISRCTTALLALLVGATFVFTACDTQTSLTPEVPSKPDLDYSSVLSQNSIAPQEEVPSHLLQFKKKVPSDFEGEVANLGGEVLFAHTATGIALVSGLSEEAAATLSQKKSVSSIEADETFVLDPLFDESMVESVDAAPSSPSDPTTASFYPRQWNMRAIHADDAWATGRTGSADVTLAILDTGIDYTYPDLAGRVDLTRSASFVPSDDDLVSTFFPSKHPVTDLHFHGTHVASTAVSNSNVIAGVTSQTTLIGVKVCDVFGSCSLGAVIAGVLHAADNGADVANMSLGGAFTKAGNGRLVGFINKVFNYANRKRMTIVVSAGNDTADLDHDGNSYKSYCSTPNTICVSATGPTASASVNGPWTQVDALASYSNFGRSAINVAAPGGTSAGSVWAACSQTSLILSVCQTGTFILGVSGTSMAAPHVSGLASLLIEDVGKKPGRVRARLQQGADDLGQSGTDPAYGKGRINVSNSLGL